MISNCNCGKKVNCGCVLAFDTYQASSVSVLTVGNLIGPPCVFTDYVIDWYRNGVIGLVSGVGDDPTIQAYHPFLGTSSIPVLPGTWVPVVRYIVLNGERVYGVKRECHDWCELIGILPVIIVVAPLNCSVTSPGVSPYKFKLEYLSSQDYGQASRKVQFDLSVDAKYFALQFNGFNVADQIDIYLNDEETLVYSMIIGTNYNTNNWSTVPKSRALQSIKKVIELPPYVTGNFLTIKITPSVLETNYNTNWTLLLKCLDDTTVFDCTVITNDTSKVTAVDMVWDPTSCNYIVNFTPFVFSGRIYHSLNSMYDEFTWGGLTFTNSNGMSIDYITERYTLKLAYTKRRNQGGVYQGQNTLSANSYGLVNYKKTNNVLEITYNDVRDYNVSVDSWTEISNSLAYFPNFVNDNTNLNFYRYIRLDLKLSEIGCGDTIITKYLYVHPTSTVAFDSINKKITITFAPITIGISDADCDNTYTLCNGIVANVNSARLEWDYNINSLCNPKALFGIAIYVTNITQSTLINTSGGLAMFANDNEPFPYINPGLMGVISPNTAWGVYLIYMEVVITAARDVNGLYIEDPIQNFEIRNKLDTVNKLITPGVLIYKIVAGVITVNNLYIAP